MLLIRPTDYDERKHSFLFPAKFPEPLILAVLELRSERIYDLELDTEAATLSAILDAARHLPGQPFSFLSQDTGSVNKLRSYRGIIPSRSSLRQLEHRRLEVQTAPNVSRLGAIVSLQGASLDDEAARLVLNYWNALIVVSKSDLNELRELAVSLMTNMESRYSRVNFRALALALGQCVDDFAMRYFPADNGRHETIALLFNESKIEMTQAFFRSLKFRFKIK
jgi:hypothetical protein